MKDWPKKLLTPVLVALAVFGGFTVMFDHVNYENAKLEPEHYFIEDVSGRTINCDAMLDALGSSESYTSGVVKILNHEIENSTQLKQCRAHLDEALETHCKYYVSDMADTVVDLHSTRSAPHPESSTIDHCSNSMAEAVAGSLGGVSVGNGVTTINDYGVTFKDAFISQVSAVRQSRYKAFWFFTIHVDDSFYVVRHVSSADSQKWRQYFVGKMKSDEPSEA